MNRRCCSPIWAVFCSSSITGHKDWPRGEAHFPSSREVAANERPAGRTSPGPSHVRWRRLRPSSRSGIRTAATSGLAIAAALALAVVSGQGTGRAAAVRPVTVAGPVTARFSTLAVVAPLGVNAASWDGYYTDGDIPGLLSRARLQTLRWPGGSWGDLYNWRTNTAEGATQPVDFAQFESVADKAGARSFITINYGTGTPALAGAWVRQAISMPGQHVALWEIGNEQYGPWEADDHPPPAHAGVLRPRAVPYIKAMRRADPSAVIGMDYALTALQAAGTGTGVTDPVKWNGTILSQDGRLFGFADVHWYPFYGTPTLTPRQIIASVLRIPAVMRSIHGTLSRYAPRAGVVIGATNISNAEISYNVQPVAALFAAGTALEWLSQGASSVDWWDLHNDGPPARRLRDALIRHERRARRRHPVPRLLRLPARLAAGLPGARLAALPTSSAQVLAFGSRHGRSPATMLINSGTGPVTVSPRGLATAAGTVRSYRYSAAEPRITEASQPAAARAIAPCLSICASNTARPSRISLRPALLRPDGLTASCARSRASCVGSSIWSRNTRSNRSRSSSWFRAMPQTKTASSCPARTSFIRERLHTQ